MKFRKTISVFEMALMISLSFAIAGILSREIGVVSAQALPEPTSTMTVSEYMKQPSTFFKPEPGAVTWIDGKGYTIVADTPIPYASPSAVTNIPAAAPAAARSIVPYTGFGEVAA